MDSRKIEPASIKVLFGLKFMSDKQNATRFVICICNDGYEVSLEKRKLYEVLPDFDTAKHHQIQVID